MQRIAFFCLLISVLAVQASWAQIPASLSYQGVLKDDQGNAVTGARDLTFRLYDGESGGSSLWELTLEGVEVNEGIFNVELAGGTPDLSALPFDNAYWLGIAVGAEAELSPRIPLTATPYSLNARIAPGAAVTSLNGLTDDVTLEAGDNITIQRDEAGNKLTISATGGGGSDGGASSGGGNVNGTGEKNFLAKWSDANNLIKSSIVEDEKGRVGIAIAANRRMEISNKILLQIGHGRNGFLATNQGAFTVGTTKVPNNDLKFLVNDLSRSGFFITSVGRVGMGTREFEINVMNSARVRLLIGERVNSTNAFMVKDDGALNIGENKSGGSFKLWVKGNAGGSNQWVTSSDRRFKTRIEPLALALEKVRSLRGVSFQRKDRDPDTREIGFIAQEVEPVLPDVVATDGEGYKSIQYGAMVSVLVEAIKEMDAEIKRLNTRIEDLEERR